MSNWFANRGQVIQTVFAALSATASSMGLYFVLDTHGLLPNRRIAVVVGVGCLLFVLFAFWGAGVFKSVVSSFAAISSRLHQKSNLVGFVSEVADFVDLPALQELYAPEFGAEAPSLEQMRFWYSCNKKTFHVIAEKNPITRERLLVASFKAIPLNWEAMGYLEMGLLKVTDFNRKHIVKHGGRASAWYVGDLVSTSRVSAIMVMKALREYLTERLKEPKPIFARPLTEKGPRLLREFRFSPVLGGKMEIGQLCSLLPPDVDSLTARLQSTFASRNTQRRIRRRGVS